MNRTDYKPARTFSLSIALLDFWCMLENRHGLEASKVYTFVVFEQAMRAEVAIPEGEKSRRYIERAITMDELIEARNEAFRS